MTSWTENMIKRNDREWYLNNKTLSENHRDITIKTKLNEMKYFFLFILFYLYFYTCVWLLTVFHRNEMIWLIFNSNGNKINVISFITICTDYASRIVLRKESNIASKLRRSFYSGNRWLPTLSRASRKRILSITVTVTITFHSALKTKLCEVHSWNDHGKIRRQRGKKKLEGSSSSGRSTTPNLWLQM